MKIIGIYLLSGFLFLQAKAQTDHADDISKKGSLIQLGYVHEFVDGGGPALQGAELQLKLFFKKQQIPKGKKMTDAFYFNLGYSYFPTSDYSLGQANAGLGIITPIFGDALQFDVGLGASYYHGTIGEVKWSGKTVDFGGHIGIGAPLLGSSTGIYATFSMPGIITTLSDDSYISPMLLSVGIQF